VNVKLGAKAGEFQSKSKPLHQSKIIPARRFSKDAPGRRNFAARQPYFVLSVTIKFPNRMAFFLYHFLKNCLAQFIQ